MSKGLTLIELMIATMMAVILAGIVTYVSRAILLSWSDSEARRGINITLNRAVEEMRRDLIKAKAIAPGTNDEIRFTTIGNANQVYYLYNPNDPYPPSFSQPKYELKKTGLSGDLTNGIFTYGNGTLMLADVAPPPISDLSLGTNLITLDLSIKKGNATIRSRTQVRPRNL